ncbi:MAG: HPr family phosphocarrier protein [Clostridia bacterium]|nr:HPr family phosphocarrier protein [Clostridia bacterium]NCC75466.1 HPr family phosphocarrier protein [Clostridia bacterium]
MITQSVTIKNPLGLHARPAKNFVQIASQYKSNVTFAKDSKSFNAKSILMVMSAGAKCGQSIELSCDGPDEQQALTALVEAIDSGLGE